MINKILDNIYVLTAGLYKCIYAIMNGMLKYPIKEDRGKNVLVLGNGPSLNNVDIEKLVFLEEGELDIVCVNYFPSKENIFWKIKPQYLCLIDSVYFEKNEIFENDNKELFDVLERVDWDIKIICFCKNTIPVKNEHITYEWISAKSLYRVSLPKFRHFLYKKNLVNCGAQNVIIAALYYFVTKNSNCIYLAGVDMSEFKFLFIDEDNNILVESTHSYGVEKVNCLDHKVVKKGEFYKLLGFYTRMFEQFSILSEYARLQKVKIYNLYKNSYIDVFEKISFYDKESDNT